MSGNSIERLLDKIEAGTSNFLIFAGVLDNNAKLLSFRRGKAKFSLPIERHDTLDVQLSLMFSLIRQLEDISGDHKFTATRFERHDIFLFGTSDFHLFVITSPASEGQLQKTMALLAAIMVESELPISQPVLAGRTTHQSGESGMASTIHHNAPNLEIQRPSSSKPEAVSILQGYLMALEPGVTIQDDFSGNFKIKSNESDQFAWSTLEKLGSVFKDKIDFHNIGLDSDGRVFVSFSVKQ